MTGYIDWLIENDICYLVWVAQEKERKQEKKRTDDKSGIRTHAPFEIWRG